MICPRCSTPNDNNAHYCKNCALPLSEYYGATRGFKPSFSNQVIPVEEKTVKPAEEIKNVPEIPEQTGFQDKKEKGTGIVWLLMWEMVTWILWFFLNDFVWASDFNGEDPHHYVNILNLCSVMASLVAVILTIIILRRTKNKREKTFLSIYSIVRIILMLIFAYRFVVDVPLI
ncbi:MAG TPA: zinc ribbon domain-containing protein [Bacteroidia bacterium]|nr:zinc ribbon domain-containing protein [Bacteroidia bacterium]